MNNDVTIQTASTDILFFASSLQSIGKDYYLTNNEFKILLKLIHYHNTNLKATKNEFITWRNDQIAEHIFSPENSVKKTISILSSKNYINVSTQTIKENGLYKKRRSISINWIKFEEVFNIIKKLKLEQPIQPEPINEIEPLDVIKSDLTNTEPIVVSTITEDDKVSEIKDNDVKIDNKTLLKNKLDDLFKERAIGLGNLQVVQIKIDTCSIRNEEELIEEYNRYNTPIKK